MEPVKTKKTPPVANAGTGQRVYDELIFVLEEEWVIVNTQKQESESPMSQEIEHSQAK